MPAIAPMLYTDWNAQLSELSGLLGKFGELDKLLGGLNPSPKSEAGTDQPASPPANAIGNSFAGRFGQQSILDSVMEITIAHEVAHQWWAMRHFPQPCAPILQSMAESGWAAKPSRYRKRESPYSRSRGIVQALD